MCEYAKYANMISNEEYQSIKNKYHSIDSKIEELKNKYISSNDPLAKKYNILNGSSLLKVIARPDVDYQDFIGDYEYKDELITKVRLEGYIDKQNRSAAKMLKLEKLKIPTNIDYQNMLNLSLEARDKLSKIKPETLGEASRISGISPSDIEVILFYINLKYKKGENDVINW